MNDGNATRETVTDTQEAVNRQLANAPADAVAAHMGEPAPATIGDQIDLFGRFLNSLHARVSEVERVIGAAAPLAGEVAALLPAGSAVSTAVNVAERLPLIEQAVNGILATLAEAFGSKLGHQLPAPIQPPVQPVSEG